MDRYEYTVIAAPDRGSRAKSAKTPTDRYALALAELLNDMAAHGWEYQRAETLPSEERSGIASRQTLWHNVLIFRREIMSDDKSADPVATTATAAATTPLAAPVVEPPPPPAGESKPAPESKPVAAPKRGQQRAVTDTPPLRRNGEEATTPPASRLGPAAR